MDLTRIFTSSSCNPTLNIVIPTWTLLPASTAVSDNMISVTRTSWSCLSTSIAFSSTTWLMNFSLVSSFFHSTSTITSYSPSSAVKGILIANESTSTLSSLPSSLRSNVSASTSTSSPFSSMPFTVKVTSTSSASYSAVFSMSKSNVTTSPGATLSSLISKSTVRSWLVAPVPVPEPVPPVGSLLFCKVKMLVARVDGLWSVIVKSRSASL